MEASALISGPNLSAALNFALLDRGLRICSCSAATTGFLVSTS
jgi:hypothetical protein